MYYLRQRTNVSGPFTAEQIKGMLHRGRVARSDKVSTDRVSWRAIGSTREIIALLHPADSVAAEEAEVEAGVVEEVDVGQESLDNRRWYYAIDGQRNDDDPSVGTMELLELIATRKLCGTDKVWRDGFEGWRPVAEVPELAAYLTHSSRNGSGGSPSGGGDDLGPIPDLRPVNRRRRKKGWF